jgi:hypothetical protein
LIDEHEGEGGSVKNQRREKLGKILVKIKNLK